MSIEELEESVIFSEWQALRHGASRSLARTAALMQQLGYAPGAQQHRIIGVVGSKGKGTAAAYASATVAGLGHRVGTVMSPGILSNADRIRVDGEILDEHTRRRALLRIQQAQQQLPPATSESGYLAPTGLFLLMGFLVFEEAGVDVVVAEAGIGGASDDLSHWPLDAVALTGIFGEHLDILGPDVTDVARNKAAVITEATQAAVCYPQVPEVADVVRSRCAATSTRLITLESTPEDDAAPLTELCTDLTAHLPQGFQRMNAAVGATAALVLSQDLSRTSTTFAQQISQNSPVSGSAWEIHRANAPDTRSPALAETVASVNYPGRLSVHQVPQETQLRCVVDSAVSAEGLRGALSFAGAAIGMPDQVLVCLPPEKDLDGVVDELEAFRGRKIFVEMPGAYIGTPPRTAWPTGPGWEWIRLDDLGTEGVHRAAGSAQLRQVLTRSDSLAVGTVLFTALVLRTVGASAQRLFSLSR